jgi:hypothetical protein
MSLRLSSAKLISVIGPPAAGKTTLAEHLARELPSRLILEDYAANPFLAESFTGSADMRLPSQLYFLVSRVKQLAAGCWPDSGLAVSDYGFCQDRIYARLLLNADDFEVYSQVAGRVSGMVHAPQLLICLDAPVGQLLRRIADRGRDYEKAMTAQFLADMQREYNALPASAGCPAVRVDTQAVDIRDAAQRAGLILAIRAKL